MHDDEDEGVQFTTVLTRFCFLQLELSYKGVFSENNNNNNNNID